MIKYLQLPFHFDVQKMREDLDKFGSSDWQLHYQKLHYDGDWTALPLRSVEGRPDNIIISPQSNPVYKDTVFLEKNAFFKEILTSFHCPLQAVRLLKLHAGATIKEHKDAGLNFENGEIRLHIPIVTHDQVEFYLDKERIFLNEGECWYLNFNLPHSIYNKSNTDRVHLVIDAKVNDWVKHLFSLTSVNKKEMEEPGYDTTTKRKIIAQLRGMNTETGNRLANEMEAQLTDQESPAG